MDLRGMLRQIWLFAALGDDDLEHVARLAKVRKWSAKDAVVLQGDSSGDLFAVVTGRLKVSSSNAAGDEVVLSILGPGDVFGEIALLDGKARSATVSALETCELLVIGRQVFRNLLLQLPPLTLSLMTVMARRLRRLTEHTQDVSLLDVERRLAKAILALAARFGEDHGHGRITLEPRLSQQELANMVGASRELVNRRLRTWVDDGIISMTAGELVIEDAGALANVAGPA